MSFSAAKCPTLPARKPDPARPCCLPGPQGSPTLPDPAVFLARKEAIEQEIEAEQAANPNYRPHHVQQYNHLDTTDLAASKDVDTAVTPVVNRSVHSTDSADNMVVVEEGRSTANTATKDVGVEGSAAVKGKKQVRYWPVMNMLRNYWVQVLLQFTWEFWFADAWG